MDTSNRRQNKLKDKVLYNAYILDGKNKSKSYSATLYLKARSVTHTLSPYDAYEVIRIDSQDKTEDCSPDNMREIIYSTDENLKILNERATSLGLLNPELEDVQHHPLTPEFLDFHEHGEFYSYFHPELDAKRRQRVRGSVLGNCGISVYPMVKGREELLMHSVLSTLGEWPKDESGNPILWKDLDGFRNILKERGVQNRLYFLTGHAALRIAAMDGNPNREATDKEIDKMCGFLDEMIAEGSIGFSTGLYYAPCVFASRKELIELLKVVKKHNALFAVHMREEGNRVLESINEVIELSKEVGGLRLEISHLKAVGVKNQIKVDSMLSLIEKARFEGLDVMFDQYPYTYGSTSLFSLLPPSALSLSDDELLTKIKDRTWREKTKYEMLHPDHFESIAELCTFDNIYIQSLGNTKEYDRKSINEIAKLRGDEDSFDTFFNLLLESKGLAVMRDTTTCDENLMKIYTHPLSIYASDSLYAGTSWHERSTESTLEALRIAKRTGDWLSAVERMTSKGAKRISPDEVKYYTIDKGSIINFVDIYSLLN